jgi:hypothetical protein
MHMVVMVLLTDGLDGWAKVSAPFVRRCLFHLAKKEETEDGGADGDAEVLELPCLCVEGIVVGLYFGLEVEGSLEDLEGFGESVVVGGSIGALSDGFEELFDGPVID